MVKPMADEFYEKYQHLSHQELYRMLRAGSVTQVDGVADTWASIASTLGGLADSLRQDMDRLLGGLDGSTSQEVIEGISALARRAKTLAEEATSVRTGLTAMSQALAAAQRQAEEPQQVPDVTTQAVGSVLGAEVGHVPTADELARARERMVWLVARLAAQYGLAEHGNWPAATTLPSSIVGGALAVLQGHGHDDGRHSRRHGTRLEGVTDVVRHVVQPSHHSSPVHNVLAGQPGGLTQTSAEAAGVLRGAVGGSRAPSVHIVGGGAPAVPLPAADAPGAPAAAAAGAAPPPPLGLGGGGVAPSGGVLGGAATPGVGAPGGGPAAGGGLAPEVTWQAAEGVEWMDPDDAAPPVIGG
jgi:hypothetical protein